MTYLYEFTDTGERLELSHSMTSPALTEHGGRPVRRLISGSREAPHLRYTPGDSSSWSGTGHAKPEHHRWAEQQLGRKLFPPLEPQ